MTSACSIVGEEDLILKLSEELNRSGFKVEEPQDYESMTDAVDSSIGPNEIQVGLQIITVAISASTSFVLLIDKIIDLRRKIETKSDARIIDIKTGADKLVISKNKSDEDLRREAGKIQ